MKQRKNFIMCSMLVVMAVMAIGYSIFATRLNINATGNITSNWNIYFSNISSGISVGNASNAITPSVTGTTATMEANLQSPGDSMTYELTLKNGGNIDAIIEDIAAEASGSNAIIYSITGIKIGDKLASGEDIVITIKIEYDPNFTSQPSELSKTLTVTIDAVQDIGQSITEGDVVIEGEYGKIARAILSNNIPQSDKDIDFSKNGSQTETNGLYYTSTNTENNKTTYYFRGAVENNYVSFGKETDGYCKISGDNAWIADDGGITIPTTESDCNSLKYVCDDPDGSFWFPAGTPESCEAEYGVGALEIDAEWVSEAFIWRIVRINEDGSIRLIKETSIGESSFNDNDSDNAYIGYMYGEVEKDNYSDTHANINQSTIKTYLDNWYVENLNDYSSIIADAGFCNDRSISFAEPTFESDETALGYGSNTTYYGPYYRFEHSLQPQFVCPNPNTDLFTLTTSNKGNKALTKPIGLITLDEVRYAGVLNYMSNESNSYIIGDGTDSWTMSPLAQNYASTDMAFAFFFRDGLGVDPVSYTRGIRPVINIKGDASFTLEGTGVPGSSNNPYIIKTN